MPDRPSGTSRRAFARALAAAAAAPALLPAVALAQAAPSATPTAAPTPTPIPTPEAPSSVAEALTEVVRIRWGKHLSGEQLADVAKALDGRLKGAEAMKKVKLANGDEPDFVFTADTERGAS
jgi:outer membrane receptor protein involved in Fe transport